MDPNEADVRLFQPDKTTRMNLGLQRDAVTPTFRNREARVAISGDPAVFNSQDSTLSSR